MSVDYWFIFSEPDEPALVAEWLVRCCAMERVVSKRDPAAGSEGIVCFVSRQSDLGASLVSEVFGIDGDTEIVCRIDKFENHLAGMSNLVRLAGELLNNYTCDLVMLSNGEQGLLLRKDGAVTVDAQDPSWAEEWRTALGQAGISYSEGRLPSL